MLWKTGKGWKWQSLEFFFSYELLVFYHGGLDLEIFEVEVFF